MLEAVKSTAQQAALTAQEMKAGLLDYKHRIRAPHKYCSRDVINNLLTYPYAKIEFLQRDLGVWSLTATKYLGPGQIVNC